MAAPKIDLDKARAARREASGEPPVVVYGGKKFKLPVELPFEVSEHAAALSTASAADDADASLIGSELREIVQLILGDGFPAFMAQRPSTEDMFTLVDGLADVYGFDDVGESQASVTS